MATNKLPSGDKTVTTWLQNSTNMVTCFAAVLYLCLPVVVREVDIDLSSKGQYTCVCVCVSIACVQYVCVSIYLC